ncbi:MAG: hypothetical protein N2255_07120 [Kiritimatiellae bacterium]|nr:hypothetical protein [Kiritimatiellia bacterium]
MHPKRSLKRNSRVGFRSWRSYNLLILRFYSRNRRNCFLVDVTNLIRKPTSVVRALFSKLDIDLPITPFDGIYDPGAFKTRKEVRDFRLMVRYPFDTFLDLILYARLKYMADRP